MAAVHFRHFERTEMALLLSLGLIKNTLGEKWLLLIWKIRNSYRQCDSWICRKKQNKDTQSFILVNKIEGFFNLIKIMKNVSGVTSEIINGRVQRTDGHCPLIGTELNLRQSTGLNMMMGFVCQWLKIKPTLSIRKSWNSFYLMRCLIMFLFNFHECNVL